MRRRRRITAASRLPAHARPRRGRELRLRELHRHGRDLEPLVQAYGGWLELLRLRLSRQLEVVDEDN